ncbi:class I SAM-dependent methyltransferase [Streptomyces sp.]|uniref:class I SAM-dependent methyltransferase n=1 Tax=Streptomyces sp. TaxID=1931 RepID=UPI002D77BCAB|nr:class I SAM-dependent methyltransferase [Streptomyces sp.]HET6358891.1 class I SAM-dependent methyltransferase [Streptomyces sp.]
MDPSSIPGATQRVSHYDAADEDYVQYWNERDYEHAAEVQAIRRLLGRRRFVHAVDVGGGYGRLSLHLVEIADRVTLLDPSSKQLQAARVILKDQPRIRPQLMASGDLGLPDQSADLVTLVRVMHHLPDPSPTLGEIVRLLKPGGIAIVEVANLAHAVNRVRYAARGQRLPRQAIDVRSPQNRTSEHIPFVNHHPATVVAQFTAAGLTVEAKLSVSNLRNARMKRALPPALLLEVERRLQAPLAVLHFGPSVFYRLSKSESIGASA